MSFQVTRNTDIILQGVNTTSLNREMIIRFTPKGSKRSKLITGRQLVELLKDSNRGKTLANVWSRITNHMGDGLQVKLRSTGQLNFVWR